MPLISYGVQQKKRIVECSIGGLVKLLFTSIVQSLAEEQYSHKWSANSSVICKNSESLHTDSIHSAQAYRDKHILIFIGLRRKLAESILTYRLTNVENVNLTNQ